MTTLPKGETTERGKQTEVEGGEASATIQIPTGTSKNSRHLSVILSSCMKAQLGRNQLK